MKAILEREADQEMIEAAQFYEEQELGLGNDFLGKIEAAIDKIGRSPKRFSYY